LRPKHTFLSSPEAFADFVAAWEAGTLSKPQWAHAAHVAMGACYAVQYRASAFERIRAGIIRYNEAVGTENTDTAGYHETLTRLWAGVLAKFVRDNGFADPWKAACTAAEKFGENRELHRAYYTFDIVRSVQARRTWIPPDLSPGTNTMTERISIDAAEFPKDADDVRRLFEEYAAWLVAHSVSWCLLKDSELPQDVSYEVATLPGKYAPPKGRLLLARCDDVPAGCVGLRALGSEICEMKRLYVRPEFRGRDLGRKLAERVIAEAKLSGYSLMRLDTVPTVMPQADSLYRNMGFYAIPPYYENPRPNVSYFELRLRDHA
jgi:GNAT superfamily N-acetyltransferase